MSDTTPTTPAPVIVELRLLGAGTFGEVCVCQVGDRTYAMKKLKTGASEDAERRFRKEVRILSRLDHPNVVKVLAQKLYAAPYLYLMPLYKCSLESELAVLQKDPERTNRIFRSILDGVEYAHREGVLHRDLKPLNVLVGQDDSVAVSDFGLGREIDADSTRLTETGFGMGTYFYRAPEQAGDAKNADVRADIYSLGKMLFVMNTGPITNYIVDLTRVPAPLRYIISKCTNDDPKRRFNTVSELKQAWLIATGQHITSDGSPSDQVNAHINLFNADPANENASVDKVLQLLTVHIDDEDFVHDAVMKMPTPMFAKLAKGHTTEAQAIVRAFLNNAIKTNYGFSYTDKIGAKCCNIYSVSDDLEIRAGMIVCLFVVGYDHNRFHVIDQFIAQIENPKLLGEGMVIVDQLKGLNPRYKGYLEQAAARVRMTKLDPTIAEYFRQLLQELKDRLAAEIEDEDDIPF